MSLHVVIDTNVIVSAMITPHPNASTVQVMRAISQEKIIPVYNEEIIAEYDEVLHRPQFNLLKPVVASTIKSIVKLGINVSRTESKEKFVDLKDLVFYEVALAKKGSYLVTGNLKHFPKSPIVVTPNELLMMLTEK
ncbi:MAG: putative toxin-antitoxin system toxin component, PIN family [Bacteroidales bacterium]|nr:putative toxin-antitoxin system toxin component, PIN family [Bacteroidales bacterium]